VALVDEIEFETVPGKIENIVNSVVSIKNTNSGIKRITQLSLSSLFADFPVFRAIKQIKWHHLQFALCNLNA